MKHPLNTVLALSLLLLAGCKKERTTTAEGWVSDPTATTSGGGVVAGARVYLLQTHGTSLFAAPTRVQHTTADADGRYSLSFEAEGDDRYALQATNPGYFDTPETEATSLETGRKNKKNVLLRPDAWLRLRLVSSSPTTTSYISLQDPTPDGLPHTFASPIDTTVVVRCKGNENNPIGAALYGSARTPTSLNEAVYCPAHDTTDYTIRF